jgi:hypothetical protein
VYDDASNLDIRYLEAASALWQISVDTLRQSCLYRSFGTEGSIRLFYGAWSCLVEINGETFTARGLEGPGVPGAIFTIVPR